jgi:serine protease Do
VPVPGPTTTVVSAGNPDPGTQVFARSKDAVALIELNTCTGNGVAVGTGFLISSNLLVTAGHVVADGRTPYVVLRGRRTAATVVGFDAVQDVALLRLPTALPGPYLPLSSKTPAVGQHVVTIGYPEPFALDFALSAEEGIVSGLNRTFQESQSGPPLTGLLQTDIPAWFGNSGGPVITYAGDVVGLIHGVVADPDGHGGLTPTPVQLSIGAATAARDVNGWASRTAAIRFC